MIRSTINGQIIKGELVTKIDADKIMIRFIKVGELNFIPSEGEKITYGLNVNGVTLTIYEDIKISICVSRPFEVLPTRERNEYVNVCDQLLIEEEDGPDTIVFKGTMIDMFIHNPDGIEGITYNPAYNEDYIHLWKDPNNAIVDEYHQHSTIRERINEPVNAFTKVSIPSDYDTIISMSPEDRVKEKSNDIIYDKICGILIAFAYKFKLRDEHIDLLTIKDANKEIRSLIDFCNN